jgi:hypothetical protein
LSKKWLLSVSLAASVSVLAACGNGSTGAEESKPETSQSAPAPNAQGQSGQPQMPKPDLSGVPSVVATVNGEKIPKKEFVQMYESQFQQMAMQSQMSGQKVDQDKLKGQVADGLVGTELLIQEAEKQGIDATGKDVQAKLKELAKSQQMGSVDKLLAAAEKQGMSKEQVTSQIETQVAVEQLISKETGNIDPTEKELKDAYKMVKAQQSQMGGGSSGQQSKIPPFEKVKGQLAEQVKSQKEAKATQGLVKDLREDAKVSINL